MLWIPIISPSDLFVVGNIALIEDKLKHMPDAPVHSYHVIGTQEIHCWAEKQQVMYILMLRAEPADSNMFRVKFAVCDTEIIGKDPVYGVRTVVFEIGKKQSPPSLSKKQGAASVIYKIDENTTMTMVGSYELIEDAVETMPHEHFWPDATIDKATRYIYNAPTQKTIEAHRNVSLDFD